MGIVLLFKSWPPPQFLKNIKFLKLLNTVWLSPTCHVGPWWRCRLCLILGIGFLIPGHPGKPNVLCCSDLFLTDKLNIPCLAWVFTPLWLFTEIQFQALDLFQQLLRFNKLQMQISWEEKAPTACGSTSRRPLRAETHNFQILTSLMFQGQIPVCLMMKQCWISWSTIKRNDH